MTKRKKIIIILIIALAVLGIIFLVLARKTAEEKGLEPKVETEKKVEEGREEISPEAETFLKPEQKKEEISLANKARTFIERAGSFSSRSQDQNLREIKEIMSQNLFNNLQEMISQELEKNKDSFYGKTTKVISLKMAEKSDIRVHFQSDVQIEETKGEVKDVFYRKAELTFLKQGAEWQAVEMAVY